MASIRLIGGNSTTPLVDRRQSFHNQVKDCLSLGSNGEVSARTKHIWSFGWIVDNPDITPFWDYFRVGGQPGATTDAVRFRC